MKRRRPKQKTVRTTAPASAVRTARRRSLELMVTWDYSNELPVLEDELILLETRLRDILSDLLKEAPDDAELPH